MRSQQVRPPQFDDIMTASGARRSGEGDQSKVTPSLKWRVAAIEGSSALSSPVDFRDGAHLVAGRPPAAAIAEPANRSRPQPAPRAASLPSGSRRARMASDSSGPPPARGDLGARGFARRRRPSHVQLCRGSAPVRKVLDTGAGARYKRRTSNPTQILTLHRKGQPRRCRTPGTHVPQASYVRGHAV